MASACRRAWVTTGLSSLRMASLMAHLPLMPSSSASTCSDLWLRARRISAFLTAHTCLEIATWSTLCPILVAPTMYIPMLRASRGLCHLAQLRSLFVVAGSSLQHVSRPRSSTLASMASTTSPQTSLITISQRLRRTTLSTLATAQVRSRALATIGSVATAIGRLSLCATMV